MLSQAKQLGFITELIQKQKNCEFSLKYALQKGEESWIIWGLNFTLVKKGIRTPRTHDYDFFLLEERILSVNETKKILKNLIQKKEFNIEGYDSYKLRGEPSLKFEHSKSSRSDFQSEWPAWIWRLPVESKGKKINFNQELLKNGEPYYPSINDAYLDFLEIPKEYYDLGNTVYVIIPDFRARIEHLEVTFSKIEVAIESPEIDLQDLLVKTFVRTGVERKTLPDVQPSNKIVEIDIGCQPDDLSVMLFSVKDNQKIDTKNFRGLSSIKEGIVIKRPKEDIVALTNFGESQNLEYKYDLKSESAKNEFIESVIAFLNTNNGTILLGVNDKGEQVDLQSMNVDDVEKIIHDSCEPPPTGIKTWEENINDKKIIIIDVPEGENKPYQSKRTKHFYVRHNASDMIMERSELMEILETGEEYPYPSSF